MCVFDLPPATELHQEERRPPRLGERPILICPPVTRDGPSARAVDESDVDLLDARLAHSTEGRKTGKPRAQPRVGDDDRVFREEGVDRFVESGFET